MSILFVTPSFGSTVYNGFMSLVATEIGKRGHDVRGLQYETSDAIDTIPVDRRDITHITTPWWAGQWYLYRQWEPVIKEYLESNEVSLVITDRKLATPTAKVADQLGIPCLFVIPGLGFTRFAPLDLGYDKRPRFGALPNSAKIQYPFIRSVFKQNRTGLRAASEIIVISEFLQQTISTTFECTSQIVRTPVPLDKVRATNVTGEYLTFINPRNILKGAEVLFQLAKRCDGMEFLVAGNFSSADHEQKASDFDNITHLGWVDDMTRVYEKTKIVLVPSLYEEGGGPRTVIEGFANGIPAIGTDRGAVPEHIDTAGKTVSDPYDMEEWNSAIKMVLDDYKNHSQKAKEKSKIYKMGDKIDEIEKIVQNV